MSTPPRKHSYRKHYLTSWGETIIGLTKSTDGRFRPIGHSTPAWSGDEAKVIHRFRMWQAEQEQGGATLQEIDDASGIHFGPTAEGKIYWTRYYHELLVRDPRQAAIELDDERLARLNELGRREPSLPLSEIGELYQNKKPPLAPNWRRQASKFWTEFCSIARATTVRDITPDDMARYHDAVLSAKKSPTYVANRFGVVKAAFAHACRRGEDIDQLNRVLGLCRMLVPPRKIGNRRADIANLSRDGVHQPSGHDQLDVRGALASPVTPTSELRPAPKPVYCPAAM